MMQVAGDAFGLQDGFDALGFGEGNETMVPLARAVVGGLAVSTVMTLLVVPVMHALVLGRRPTAVEPPTEPDTAEEM